LLQKLKTVLNRESPSAGSLGRGASPLLASGRRTGQGRAKGTRLALLGVRIPSSDSQRAHVLLESLKIVKFVRLIEPRAEGPNRERLSSASRSRALVY